MRSLSETGGKLLSKIPKLPIETEWLTPLTEQVEKWSAGCHKGYAKLQSSRISRGRLTMTDKSDEKATAAWTEQAFQKDSAAEQWPQILRPQRPEQITLNRYRQSQMRKGRRKSKLPVNPDVDIFENPPVFLQMKDTKKQKEEVVCSGDKVEKESSHTPSRADTPRRKGKRREVIGGATKDSPSWPSALLTYEKGVSSINSPHHLTQP